MTYQLYEWQKEYLSKPEHKKMLEVLMNIEIPLIPVLSEMYRYGVNINEKMLEQLYKKYNERLEVAKEQVYTEIAKHQTEIDNYIKKQKKCKLENPVNIASPVQLAILFYDILGYEVSKDGRGTGVEDLERLNTDLTNALLEYRKMSKLIDAFLVSLPKQIEPMDGKIHTRLNQYGAATGRFSSSSPNLQQIPSRGEGKEIRRIFGATKGYIMLSSDFSQQEPVLIWVI